MSTQTTQIGGSAPSDPAQVHVTEPALPRSCLNSGQGYLIISNENAEPPKQRGRQVMSPRSDVEPDALGEPRLRELIISKNRDTLGAIVRQLRSPLGVIPFVGAGMSATVKVAGDTPSFPQWGPLLEKLADGRGIAGNVK